MKDLFVFGFNYTSGKRYAFNCTVKKSVKEKIQTN